MVAISRNSKPDTVLLLDFAVADPWVDYSQMRTNLTDDTTYLSEANSARTAINAPREISIVFNHATGESGVLLNHGNGVTYGYRVDIAGNSVFCREGGTTRATAALPGHNAAGRKFVISWCQHLDGANVRSELLIYNTTSAAYTLVQATHTAGSTSATDTLTVGASFGGLNTFTGGLDFDYVRIGRRFHSTTEAREDWIAQRTPPTMTQVRRAAPLIPDRSTIDVGNDGSFAGPAHLWSGDTFEQADRRLMGPLVQQFGFSDWIQVRPTHDEFSNAWWTPAPGPGNFYLGLPFLWYRRVPGKCNRIRASVQLQQNCTSVVGTTATISYRVFSLAGFPVAGEGQTPLSFHHTPTVTNTVETTAVGEWKDLGSCGIAVDDYGMTWLALGIAYVDGDPLGATTTTTPFNIRIEPYYDGSILDGVDQSDGGVGI